MSDVVEKSPFEEVEVDGDAAEAPPFEPSAAAVEPGPPPPPAPAPSTPVPPTAAPAPATAAAPTPAAPPPAAPDATRATDPAAGGPKTVQVGDLETQSIGAANRIDRFLSILPKRNGSDLHLAVGSPPLIRIDGDLERIRYRTLTEGDFYNLVGPITPPKLWQAFSADGDIDFAYQMGTLARFRVNLLRQERGSAAVFRLIPSRVPTADELRLPDAISKLSEAPGGLVLVTGPTGSGKSTTLAAILNRVNERLSYHVVTIEDPIEFVHENARSIFTQREIGADVPTFASGVKAAIREDPDCLLVGEMRDLETIRMALTAAETGLLVFATLHTNSAAKAVDRIIDAFPANEQEQIRIVLAENLRAVVAQQLLRKPGGGRTAAFEILLGSTALSNAIREGKTSLITNQIQTGRSRGMISMDQSLIELLRAGAVESEEALERAHDRESVRSVIASLAQGDAPPPRWTTGPAAKPGRSTAAK
jgi:twitching motility protein PilT